MASDRRPQRPKAKRRIVVDGSVIQPGETVPRSVPLRDLDRLRSHGYVAARKGDDGIDTG